MMNQYRLPELVQSYDDTNMRLSDKLQPVVIVACIGLSVVLAEQCMFPPPAADFEYVLTAAQLHPP